VTYKELAKLQQVEIPKSGKKATIVTALAKGLELPVEELGKICPRYLEDRLISNGMSFQRASRCLMG